MNYVQTTPGLGLTRTTLTFLLFPYRYPLDAHLPHAEKAIEIDSKKQNNGFCFSNLTTTKIKPTKAKPKQKRKELKQDIA